MKSTNSTCVCCGQDPTTKTNSTVSSCNLSTAWSSACAESVVSTLQLDAHYKPTLELGPYCSPCLEIVREVDYLTRTIDKLQKRLTHFQNKLSAAFDGRKESNHGHSLNKMEQEKEGTLSTADDELEDDMLDPNPIAICPPSVSTMKLDGTEEEEFMEVEEDNLNSDESSDWSPSPSPSSSSLRQRLIHRRKLMPTGRGKRGRRPVQKLKCTWHGCDFEYSANNEKSYQVHLRKVHGEEQILKPVPEGKVCSGSRCTKEGCEISPAAREILRLDFNQKDFKGQNEFLSQCVSIEKPKQCGVHNSRKKYTFKYSIPAQDSRKPVCRQTLLSIFRIGKDKIRIVTEKLQGRKGFDDLRGKHENRGQPACNEFSHPPNFQVEGGEKLPCPSCTESFPLICCLRRHIRNIHKAVGSEKLICAKCGFVFPIGRELDLEIHEELHGQREAENRKFSCVLPTCDKFFVNSFDLKRHVRTDHPVEGLLHCEFCISTFAKQKGLREHFKKFHYDDNPFRCGTCRYKGTSREDLENHKATHAAFKYACAECGISFKFVTNFRTHMVIHHKPQETWPHPCTFTGCGRRFVRGYQLKAHEESHQDVKTYMCEKCPKMYKTLRVMRNHMFLKHK